MPFQAMEAFGELEAEFTKIHNWDCGKIFGIRWKIPRLDEMFAKLDHFDVFHARDDVVVATIMDHTAPCSQTAHFIADTVRAIFAVNLVVLITEQWSK